MLKKDSLGKEKVRKTPEYTAKTHWASITKFGRIYSAPFLFVLLPVIVLFALKADVSIAGWLSSLVNMQINRFVVLAAIAVILWQVVVCWCIWLPCLIKFKATPLHEYSFYNDIMEHKTAKTKKLPKFYRRLRFLINLVPTLILIIIVVVILLLPKNNPNPPLPEDATVSFDTRGGSSIADVEVKVGETVAKPINPTKTDCTFDGWYQDILLIYPWNFEKDVVLADMTLYAKWKKDIATVTFDSRGGSDVPSVTVNGGEKISKPVDPTREDYIFKGWYRDPAYLSEWQFNTYTVTDDITLYAKWEEEIITVKFDTLGGNKISSVTVKNGDLIPQPEDPTKEDCTFKGWYKDTALISKWDFDDDVVSRDITLYAGWEGPEEPETPPDNTILIGGIVLVIFVVVCAALSSKEKKEEPDFSERTIDARSILAFTETEKRFADPKVVLPETTPKFIKHHVFRHAINYNFGDVIIRSPKGMNDDIVLNNIEDPDKLMNYLDSIRKRPSEVASYNSNH